MLLRKDGFNPSHTALSILRAVLRIAFASRGTGDRRIRLKAVCFCLMKKVRERNYLQISHTKGKISVVGKNFKTARSNMKHIFASRQSCR